MCNGKQYEKPVMDVTFMKKRDVVTASELGNGGTGTGDSGGLPSEINSLNF